MLIYTKISFITNLKAKLLGVVGNSLSQNKLFFQSEFLGFTPIQRPQFEELLR